eukprot:TRINITY_DN16797_c0_g1_i2.p1 TRINITY_DN16797_c0_g1~~TRINITY_DN16797_c0_g1_i2.p1  ORF type:complete len:240 (-),score=22.96 TRINITY_DN16797_c0_g1_i2:60-686(-)
MAELLMAQGKCEEAAACCEEALVFEEASLGSHHPNVAITLNNIAVLYKRLGRFDPCVGLYQRALAISEATVGAHHPDVGFICNNLGQTYSKLGHLSSAIELYDRAHKIFSLTYGAKHHTTRGVETNMQALQARFSQLATPNASPRSKKGAAPDNEVGVCSACKKSFVKSKLLRCAKCRVTLYCSANCQKTDWNQHKKPCKLLTKAATP